MSNRGSEFMRAWVQTQIISHAHDPSNAHDIQTLAAFCVADAKMSGIKASEIEEEYGNAAVATIIGNEIREDGGEANRFSAANALV